MICLTPNLSQSKEKSFLRKRGSWGLNKKRKGFLTALATAIKKDPLNVNKKAREKTVRTAIKQDLYPDLNPLDYAI